MDKKKILIIVSIIMIIVSIGLSVYLLVDEDDDENFIIDGINLPKNKEVLKDAIVDGLKITNVSLLTRNGISTFKAKVINERDTDINIKNLSIIFYEGNVKTKISALKNGSILSGNSVYINIDSGIDLSNTSKIEYVLE